jgi:hypothetical protein
MADEKEVIISPEGVLIEVGPSEPASQAALAEAHVQEHLDRIQEAVKNAIMQMANHALTYQVMPPSALSDVLHHEIDIKLSVRDHGVEVQILANITTHEHLATMLRSATSEQREMLLNSPEVPEGLKAIVRTASVVH